MAILSTCTATHWFKIIMGLQPYMEIARGCCGATVLLTALIPVSALQFLGFAHTVPNNGQNSFFHLFVILFLSNAVAFAVSVAGAVSDGSLSTSTGFVSESALGLAALIHAEQLNDAEYGSSVFLVRMASWCLLCATEILTMVQLSLLPQPKPTLAFRLNTAIAVCKLSTCGIILSRALPAILENYKTAFKPEPGPISALDGGSNSDNVLDLQMDMQREAKELGGWWPLLKRFGVLFAYMWPLGQPLQLLLLATSFLLMLTNEVVEMREQLAFASILDEAAAGSNLWPLFKRAMVLGLINIALPYVHGLLRMEIRLRRTKAFATNIHTKLLSMDATFHSLVNPTDLTKAADDSTEFVNLIDSILFTHLIELVGVLMAAGSLISGHGTFFLVIIAYQVFFTYLVNKTGIKRRTEAKVKLQRSQLSQDRRRQDGLRGWTTLLNNNLIEHEVERFNAITGTVIEHERQLDVSRLNFSLWQSMVSHCGIAAGYSFVIYQYGHGAASAGDLMLFFSLWVSLWTRFGNLTRVFPDLVDAFVDAAPLRRILQVGSTVQAGGAELKCTDGGLELRQVSFAYQKTDALVVDRLSISIKPRTKVAFIGPSGTGKTTLLRLLMRYMSPRDGVVLIDGQDISKVNKNSFHESVGMMPQIPHMFNAPVMENVRVGKADSTDNEVYDACRRAMIHDIIMARPEGYKTQMGEQGGAFSGGEEQRIEFARLFLKRPKIVILDEPTSSLDRETEMQVLANLINHFVDTTVIVVTHHVELVKDFDRIILVGQGGKILKDSSYNKILANEQMTKPMSLDLMPTRTPSEGVTKTT